MPAEKIELRRKIRDQAERATPWGRLKEDQSPVREVSEVARASDDPRVMDITGMLIVGSF
jgi:hypothetical protein